jgi:glutamate:GABA antiporter
MHTNLWRYDVAEVTADELVYETTASAVQEKKKLRRHFGRFDMFFFLICTVVTLDTVGAVAANGAQGFTWLIFLGIFFLLPYALSIAELGSAFPQEGGPYVWTRLAFGRPLAAVNSVIYWISNPIWVGGTLTIVSFAAAQEFFGFDGGDWKYVYALAFIWFVIGAAIVSLQYGKWVPTAGAWARGVLLVFFAVTVIAYAAKNGVHGFGGHEFLPTYALFVAVVPVLIFNYAGMEVPSAASEEMTNPQKDVPFSVLWSGTATMFAYAVPILLILIVLPVSQVTGLTGFLDAIKATFTIYGGHVASDGTATLTGAGLILGRIVAVVFIFALAAAGTTWIMGSDRTEAIASVDGGGPRILGRFSARFGTPAVMNVVSGLVATALMIATFQITAGNSAKYFTAVLGLTISTTTVSYLFIFPALAKLRYSRPDVARPYRVPGGMAGVWICTILPTFWALVATVFLLWPGLGVNWFGAGGNPNDSLAGLSFSGERLEYELSQFVPLAIVILLGVVFYFLGSKTRRDEVEEPIAPAIAPAGASAPVMNGAPAGASAPAGDSAAAGASAPAGDSAAAGDVDGASAAAGDGAAADGSASAPAGDSS